MFVLITMENAEAVRYQILKLDTDGFVSLATANNWIKSGASTIIVISSKTLSVCTSDWLPVRIDYHFIKSMILADEGSEMQKKWPQTMFVLIIIIVEFW